MKPLTAHESAPLVMANCADCSDFHYGLALLIDAGQCASCTITLCANCRRVTCAHCDETLCVACARANGVRLCPLCYRAAMGEEV